MRAFDTSAKWHTACTYYSLLTPFPVAFILSSLNSFFFNVYFKFRILCVDAHTYRSDDISAPPPVALGRPQRPRPHPVAESETGGRPRRPGELRIRKRGCGNSAGLRLAQGGPERAAGFRLAPRGLQPHRDTAPGAPWQTVN